MFWVAIAAPFGELISSANLKLARFPTRSPLALAALPSISRIPSPPSAAQAVTATGQPNPQEMMKQMIEMSKLNENHKLLSSLDGSWNYTIKMPGEDDKMKDVQFKGMGLEGYDNVKKKFINSWIDNMGTGIQFSEGTYDPATKTLTYTSEMEPVPGMKSQVREVIKIADNNHMTLA